MARSPWTRRAFLTLAAVVGAAGVGAVVAHHTARARYAPPIPLATGVLTVADDVPATISFGDHRITLTKNGLDLRDHRDRSLWASGSAFLAVVHGSLTWHEHVGHFSSERVLDFAGTDQTVTELAHDTRNVTLRGRLAGPGSVEGSEYTLTLRSVDRERLGVEVEVLGGDLVLLRFDRAAEEGIHGLGAQFTDFDLTGRYVPVVVREQGVGRGREPLTTLAELTQGGGGAPETTYAAIPFAVTDALRAVSVDTHHPSAFDLRPNDRFDVEVWRPSVRATLYSGDTPADLLRAHTEDTGRPEPLAEWSGEGAVVGVQGGTEAVRAAVADLRAAGARITGVWVQDWSGQRRTGFGERLWWNWVLDRERYPGWEELVAELDADGIRMLTYVNPFVVDTSDKPDPARRDLFHEALAAGFLVARPDGGPYLLDQGGFEAALVDLTHPDAWEWFRDVIVDEVAGAGASGWMADFAEGLPLDAVLHDGDPKEWHNRWPVEWARLNQEARETAGIPDALVFHRSAGAGSAAHAGLFWAGDQLVTFDRHDGFGSAIRGLLSAGVSGMTLNHSDTGGYTGLDQPLVGVSRDRELLLRWVETNVWGPVLRTHEGNLPGSNAQVYDADSREAFAEQTRVFEALAEYRRGVVAEAVETGMPVLRHVWLRHPDSAAARSDEVFLFGDSFLVAPVLGAGESEVTVTLPPGTWRHLWSGDRHEGDEEVTVPAPPGRPAVFFPEGDARGEELRERLGDLVD
ncbi:alpha-glucosidase [Nocardiopsis sp. NPDC055551]|uniref:alpha-glucosidase n=1 Tax=Nocardiopsis sp. NPDC006832 TaxID=3157188 RepID=UPI0033C897D3